TRALISVYDKTGIVELARTLAANGVEIVSTGSTGSTIRDAGIAVTDVATVTGSPEMLDGRVKTLHPRIHGGILADQRLTDHREQLEAHQIAPFDLVVVNLYPFSETVAAGGGFDEIIEKIDVGGPTMVRAAAKNFASVAVVVDPEGYSIAAEAATSGGFTLAERQQLAAIAFTRTAEYDDAISDWMLAQLEDPEETGPAAPGDAEPEDDGAELSILDLSDADAAELGITATLRYGENPHQRARLAVTDETAPGLAGAEQLGGKEMSYNNYVDADAAVRAAHDHSLPAVAVVKHNNPCGVAVAGEDEVLARAHARPHGPDPVPAYGGGIASHLPGTLARAPPVKPVARGMILAPDHQDHAPGTDPVSADGGVSASKRPVTLAMAQQVQPVFAEVILAPDYEDEALELLRTKKSLRILRLQGQYSRGAEMREIWGGMLIQDADTIAADGDDPSQWTLAAGEAADEATLADLAFAWRSVRAVKSNAILLAKDSAAVGIGMGQVNRLDSCPLAVSRANTLGAHAEGEQAPERARGAVAASDAFFPFADGAQILIDAGVTAIVQPG